MVDLDVIYVARFELGTGLGVGVQSHEEFFRVRWVVGFGALPVLGIGDLDTTVREVEGVGSGADRSSLGPVSEDFADERSEGSFAGVVVGSFGFVCFGLGGVDGFDRGDLLGSGDFDVYWGSLFLGFGHGSLPFKWARRICHRLGNYGKLVTVTSHTQLFQGGGAC